MHVSEFQFDLPQECIAQTPVDPRDASRMLVVEGDGTFSDNHVRDITQYFHQGDVLVLNNTKVIPSRIIVEQESRKVEVTLIEDLKHNQWKTFAKPARKLHVGKQAHIGSYYCTIKDKLEDGSVIIEFDSHDNVMEILANHGHMPLPPYIKRDDFLEADHNRYQTVFAQEQGAVAAPTAGLHFTPELLEALKNQGVMIVYVTLHVGAGTFLPVKVDDTDDHQMHSEYGVISSQTATTINHAKEQGNRIFAVGTTSMRILESASDDHGILHPFTGSTDIFITPGYRFKLVDRLMTNFHLPGSTLFMLVSAFSGLNTMKAAYQHAITHGYRFYSYGDACLLYPNKGNDHDR